MRNNNRRRNPNLIRGKTFHGFFRGFQIENANFREFRQIKRYLLFSIYA